VTLIYGDKISQYMLRHGVSRRKAKRKHRGILAKERARAAIPVRGVSVAGTGKAKRRKKK
jgi:hypothetical protein